MSLTFAAYVAANVRLVSAIAAFYVTVLEAQSGGSASSVTG